MLRKIGRALRAESLSSESGCVSTYWPSALSVRSFWMLRPLGVYHLAVVILSA